MSGASDLQLFEELVENANALFLSDEDYVVINGVTKPTLKKIYAEFLASVGTFQTIAEGLTATNGTGISNRFFTVPGTGDVFETRYRNDAGVAVQVGRISSVDATSALAALVQATPSDSASIRSHEFVDRQGFIVAWLERNGMFHSNGLETALAKLIDAPEGLELSDLNGFLFSRFGPRESVINGLVVRPADPPGIRITDPKGFVIPGYQQEPDMPLLELGRQVRTAVMHLIGFGQSLIRGVRSSPIISTTQPYQNLMLASGIKVRPTDIGYGPGSFLPAVETQTLENGSTGEIEGESPMSGACNGLVRRIVAEGGLAEDWRFLVSSCGRGARRIEELFPDMSNRDYNALLQTVRDAKALCDSQGKTYSVWAFIWAQGENNYTDVGAANNAFEYAVLQTKLFDMLAKDVSRISMQPFRPYTLTYQVATHRKAGLDAMPIALAQWRVTKMFDHMIMSAPAYMFPTVTQDYTHLTNEASWLMGEYHSRALYASMIKGASKWRPLEPVSVDWQPGYVDVKFHVPYGPLVLDTALCAQQVNQGFDIREADAVVTDLITGVSVTAPDTLRLTLNRAAASSAVLTYARGRIGDPARSGPSSGARGNLRDSHGTVDTVVSPLGNTFALHNACVMFEYSRISGF
jgi:hypothetical protein